MYLKLYGIMMELKYTYVCAITEIINIKTHTQLHLNSLNWFSVCEWVSEWVRDGIKTSLMLILMNLNEIEYASEESHMCLRMGIEANTWKINVHFVNEVMRNFRLYLTCTWNLPRFYFMQIDFHWNPASSKNNAPREETLFNLERIFLSRLFEAR